MNHQQDDSETFTSELEALLEDKLAKGDRDATVMSNSCHGGGGSTTTNAPGCSDSG